MSRRRMGIIEKARQAPDYFRWLHKLSPKARLRYEAACDRADKKLIRSKLQDTPEMVDEMIGTVRRFREQVLARCSY